MRFWCSESVDKKAFIDYLSDVYSKKPVLAAEVRNMYNSCIRNFTVANDPHSSKFAGVSAFIQKAVRDLVSALPPEITIFYDWLAEGIYADIDYFVFHDPKDSDAIFRVRGGEFDIVKEQSRALDQWKKVRLKFPGKMLILNYDERVRDLFTIEEDSPNGVLLTLSPDFISSHKSETNPVNEDLASEKMYNPQGFMPKENTNGSNRPGYPD